MTVVQIVDGTGKQQIQKQVHDLVLLLDLMSAGLASGSSFDLLQGVLALALQLHGPTIRKHARLRLHAAALHSALTQVWGQRLDPTLHGTRCMLGFLSGSLL